MKKETIGDRIRLRRKSLQLTQKALAAQLAVSHVAVSQWEKEETQPRGENLLRLAEVLSCAPAWLIDGEGQVFVFPSTETGQQIPLLARTALDNWLVTGLVSGDETSVSVDTALSAGSFALRLEENAMQPACQCGDVLLFDPEVLPQPGNYVLAKHPEHGYLLRVWRPRQTEQGEHYFELAALNPDYPLLRSTQHALQVVATLVEMRRRF
ncbi:helix-turn-helix domain-containing protein [Candidatus Pantoea multigeneris]|uniref:Helix-turn-helix domain-containing protein n=1 Tax=Candidatus Pantoea multigeneris TaxID=2608357 RepID=A0ABX0R8T8_9GAMM|nr:helix-turn-helix domain-containing protein [Pantoea multigeneris]NIF21781.1 helix-turn-helix domain-containing protein [Pantoea multigeneris]